MFGSQILEVGIGLILVFLLVSLILTAVRESIESIAKTRARDLERAIAELLKDPDGEGLRKKLYTHPLVYSLFPGGLACTRFDEAGKVIERAKKNVPSYIPREVFSAALQDILKDEMARAGRPGAAPRPDAAEGAGALALGTAHVIQAYQALLDVSGGEADRVRKGIESWYDASMDRASGWFKRRTQLILFGLGVGIAVLLNINAITIAQYLATNQAVREGMVELAGKIDEEHAAEAKADREAAAGKAETSTAPGDEKESAAGNQTATAAPEDNLAAANGAAAEVADPAPAEGTADGNRADSTRNASTATQAARDEKDAARIAESMGRRVQAIGLPVGWDEVQLARIGREWDRNPLWTLLSLLIGWLMVGFAATLGAPFWFDLLGKFMVVRSTVKPTEKSPDEVSKDGGTGGSPKKPKEDEEDKDDKAGGAADPT
jgi:hypothetical protein